MRLGIAGNSARQRDRDPHPPLPISTLLASRRAALSQSLSQGDTAVQRVLKMGGPFCGRCRARRTVYRSSHRLDDTSGARLLALLRGEGAALDFDTEAHRRFRGGVRAGGPAPDVLLRLRASHDFAELRIEVPTRGSPAVLAAGPVPKCLAALRVEPLGGDVLP